MFYFLADSAPLSELSWSSSLAVVAVSFSGLFTVIVLMLACLCCKKGGIGFKVRAQDPPTTRLPFIQGLPWDPVPCLPFRDPPFVDMAPHCPIPAFRPVCVQGG